jgi:hypothetical protein
MDPIILAACELVGADPDRLLVERIYKGEITLVVDNGIAGCPKYQMPLVLIKAQKVEPSTWPCGYGHEHATRDDALACVRQRTGQPPGSGPAPVVDKPPKQAPEQAPATLAPKPERKKR